jgi:hypothetical protein
VLLSFFAFPVVKTGGASPNINKLIFETRLLKIAKTIILHGSSPRITPEKTPFTPLVVPRCFDNFHFYSKIDGTRKMDRSDRKWQAIWHLMPPVHRGRAFPLSRHSFLKFKSPPKMERLQAYYIMKDFSKRTTLPPKGICSSFFFIRKRMPPLFLMALHVRHFTIFATDARSSSTVCW